MNDTGAAGDLTQRAAENCRLRTAHFLSMVDGIAEGPDGKLYLLTPGRGEGSSHALERFDSVEGTLERAELTLPFDRGPVRMVAAEDGLVLASENAAGGAWWIGWEAVAEGAWKAVEAVRVAPAVQVAPTASEAVDR